jgi:hypothetical protein
MSTGYSDTTRTSPAGGAGYTEEQQRQDLHQGVERRPEIEAWTYDETRKGPKTTEFWLTLVAVAGVLVATYLDSDTLTRADGWRFASFLVIAYVISRGISKLGVRDWRRESR